MDRSSWPVKKYRLGEEPPEPKPASIQEAWDWTWRITLDGSSFLKEWSGEEGMPRESRLQRDVVHIVRGGS